MAREQFTFYRSFWEACKNLKDADRLSMLDAVCAYALDGEVRPMTGASKGMFILIKPVLDNAERKSRAGSARNRKETNDEQNANRSETEREQNVVITLTCCEQNAKEKEIEKEIENEIEIERENEIEIEREKDIFISLKEEKEKEEKSARQSFESSGLEKKAFGEYVRLDLVEYGELVRELGIDAYFKAKKAVDGVENENCDDWPALIRQAARKEGMP